MRQNKLFLTLLSAAVFAFVFFYFKNSQPLPDMPAPTNGKKYRDNQVEEEGDPGRREAWMELIHKAAPGTDWREMDRQAAKRIASTRYYTAPQSGMRSIESFADGILEGEWRERGSKNQAGSMRTVEYVPELDKIYGIADGGSLWRGNLDGSDWTVLNDDFLLHPEVLEAIYPSDTSIDVRLVGASGKHLIYSDDEGQTWEDSKFNPDFYDTWGSPNNVVMLPGFSKTIYYLAHTWDADPWAPRSWLYRSTDGGENFERVHIFEEEDKRRVSLWAPTEGEDVYVLEGGNKFYKINENETVVHDTEGLSTEGQAVLTGHKSEDVLYLYALMDKYKVHLSTDGGLTWNLQGEIPADAWEVGMVCSPFDPLKLFSGAVNGHFSYDGGITWQLVNEWWEYFSNVDFLHADIMDLKFYEKTDGTPFSLIANHGGLHVSYNHLASTQNISLDGMNISQYYDVVTNQEFPDFMYTGSQDQGWQWTDEGDEESPVDFIQQWTGDYGQMLLTRNSQSFWTQYPGGIMDYYHFATNPLNPWPESEWDLIGEHIPALNWIVPTANLEAFPNANSVFVGGGNINGGPGSYLISLTASTAPPYEISAEQFDFDFRQHSNTGEGLISAIEQSTFFDGNLIYVVTDDGSFFRTLDGGEEWDKTPGFEGPTASWIFTTCILASKFDSETVWVSGSGYSNPPVFQSRDAGETFEPISEGLPGTLVQELVANPEETLLFAATTLGPFVYVTWEEKWFPLLGESTPLQWYTSLEYIVSEDIVRFGTFGRGIWDFEVTLVDGPPVAVLDNAKDVEVSVFPNPASLDGVLNVKIDWSSEVRFELMDIQGRVVKQSVFTGQAQVDLHGLVSGVYAYSVFLKDERLAIGKVLVE